jgi:hypothetical protein
MQRVKDIVFSRWFLSVGCLLLGALVVLGVRFVTYQPEKGVHYHANFAVYINGQREAFKAPNYYEEEAVTTCSASETSETETTPMSRVHMHGNVNDVVHVEDSRVTWGNFFTVLGWNVGPSYLATRDGMYQNGSHGKVTYTLNGKVVPDISNTIINDQDKLLVNYGNQNADQVGQEYALIKNNALAADQSKDPAGCGGNHADSASMTERMRHMF